jgi:hypothetical protein
MVNENDTCMCDDWTTCARLRSSGVPEVRVCSSATSHRCTTATPSQTEQCDGPVQATTMTGENTPLQRRSHQQSRAGPQPGRTLGLWSWPSASQSRLSPLYAYTKAIYDEYRVSITLNPTIFDAEAYLVRSRALAMRTTSGCITHPAER